MREFGCCVRRNFQLSLPVHLCLTMANIWRPDVLSETARLESWAYAVVQVLRLNLVYTQFRTSQDTNLIMSHGEPISEPHSI